jgi:hypothetical protein
MQGKNFTTDFRAVSLKGYDLMMGTDWILIHSPVEFDYRSSTRELGIEYNGQERVVFKDAIVQ